MGESIIVGGIILAAAFYLFRCYMKSRKMASGGCGSGKACGCRRKRS